MRPEVFSAARQLNMADVWNLGFQEACWFEICGLVIQIGRTDWHEFEFTFVSLLPSSEEDPLAIVMAKGKVKGDVRYKLAVFVDESLDALEKTTLTVMRSME